VSVQIDYWSWKCTLCGFKAQDRFTVNPQQQVAEAIVQRHIQSHESRQEGEDRMSRANFGQPAVCTSCGKFEAKCTGNCLATVERDGQTTACGGTFRFATRTEILGEARRLVREGKVAISPTVPSEGELRFRAFKNGIEIGWNRSGIGFGSLTLFVKDGAFRTDREGMNIDFCLDIVRQALEEEDARANAPRDGGSEPPKTH
jgi:hypothetical protein